MSDSEIQEFVTVTIADQMFGIPVLQVHDVLGSVKLTNIPLAPPEVAGALNLRGRIVTAIDVVLVAVVVNRGESDAGSSGSRHRQWRSR